MEGKDRPLQLGRKEYTGLGAMVSLMLRMCKPIFVTGKDVVLESGFFVVKGITKIESKGVCAGASTKKQRY